MTCGICLPQPHQEEREHLGQVPRMHILLLLDGDKCFGQVDMACVQYLVGYDIDMPRRNYGVVELKLLWF
jgi:hypothetical protein